MQIWQPTSGHLSYLGKKWHGKNNMVLQTELADISHLTLKASLAFYFSFCLLSYLLLQIYFQKDKWVKMACAVFREPMRCPAIEVHSLRDGVQEGAQGHVLLSDVPTHLLLASAGKSLQAQLKGGFETKTILKWKRKHDIFGKIESPGLH